MSKNQAKKAKAKAKKEWEEKVKADEKAEEKAKAEAAKIKEDKEMEDLEEILLDETKCQEVQNKVTASQINNFISDQVEAVTERATDFDELD